MKNFDVITRELPVEFSKVFDYAADPQNLPEWAEAFKKVSNDNQKAIINNTGEDIEIGITTNVDKTSGRIDWLMELPDNVVVKVFTRFIKIDNNKTIYNFVYIMPEMPTEEEMSAVLENQTAEVHKEFDNLVRILT